MRMKYIVMVVIAVIVVMITVSGFMIANMNILMFGRFVCMICLHHCRIIWIYFATTSICQYVTQGQSPPTGSVSR